MMHLKGNNDKGNMTEDYIKRGIEEGRNPAVANVTAR
jgi:hypothetical protein